MKSIRFRPGYFAFLLFLVCLIFIIEALTANHLNYMFDFVGYGGTFKNHDLKVLGIPAYWFAMLAGLAVSIGVSYFERKKYSLSKIEALAIPVLFLIVSFVGGKMLYVLENFASVAENGIELSGLSLFGAIFIVPAVVFVSTKFVRHDFALILDICALFGLILLTCVRIGCFINNCCGAFTMWYGEKPIILPVQLIEAVFDLVILDICLYVQKKHFRDGFMYPVLMIGYGSVRFALEFFRKNDNLILGLSRSHILSIICVIIGLILFYKMNIGFKQRKTKRL